MRYLWAHGGPRKRERASSRVAAIRRWSSKGSFPRMDGMCMRCVPVARKVRGRVECGSPLFLPSSIFFFSSFACVCNDVTIIRGHDTIRARIICIRSAFGRYH